MALLNVGTTASGPALIGPDETTVGGNDRSAVPQDATAISTGPTDLKAGGTITLASATGKITYMTGISIDYHGATAASVITGLVSGSNLLVGGARVITVPVPIGATVIPEKIIIQYDPPLTAVGTNATVTLLMDSFGAGAGVANVVVNGYQR
jgi:hypothetical protein